MASPASLSVGSVRPGPSAILDVGPTNGVVPRYRVMSLASFTILPVRSTYTRGGMCKCMVSTGLVEDKVIKVSSNSDLRETSNGGTNTSISNSSSSSSGAFVLKPAPKPVLVRPSPPAPVTPLPRGPQKMELDRQKLVEKLDETLEKVEKLEMKSSIKPVSPEVGNNMKNSAVSRPDTRQKVVNTAVRNQNSFKSVWKKGDAVAPTQQKVVKEVPKVETRIEIQREEEQEKVSEREREATFVESQKPGSIAIPSSSAKPPPVVLPKPQVIPKFQSKPSVSPPVAHVGVRRPDAPKEHKGPILIDRFAAKKPEAVPLDLEETEDLPVPTKEAGDLSVPTKPVKWPLQPRKDHADRTRRKPEEEDHRSRRRPKELPPIDGPNAGMPSRRGARRRRRMIRNEARRQAEAEAQPVKAEIIEVGEEGMLLEELAELLVVTKVDLIDLLYTRGIPPEATKILDRDMVKMVCAEYEVEVLDADKRVEEMAKKKEVLDEEDLDLLETRPPVITIMGHVDHGKVNC